MADLGAERGRLRRPQPGRPAIRKRRTEIFLTLLHIAPEHPEAQQRLQAAGYRLIGDFSEYTAHLSEEELQARQRETLAASPPRQPVFGNPVVFLL